MISDRRAYGRMMVIAAFLAAGAQLLAAAARSDDRVPFPKPETHRGAWVDNHGISASLEMNAPAQVGKACLVCHEKSDCFSCHATRPPRDHTNYWRTSGHGMAASVSRERCQICHRQDYCVRCHNETAPRSHTAGWLNRHCQWCHISGKVPPPPCGVCHKKHPH